MKIVVACPVRFADGKVNTDASLYIARLQAAGHDVFSYWDTLMDSDPTGSDILERHLQATRECDEFHVFWSEKSRGVHWETGVAVALNKKIVIVDVYDWSPVGQSYLTALCQRPEVEWRVEKLPRPESKLR